MPSNRVVAAANNVNVTNAEGTVVTVTPAAPNNQASTQGAGTLVRGEICLTGVASGTNCRVRLRRGSGTGGTDITAQAATYSVDAAATARTLVVEAIETDANFNATNGQYTLTAVSGAAVTLVATLAILEIQPLSAGV